MWKWHTRDQQAENTSISSWVCRAATFWDIPGHLRAGYYACRSTHKNDSKHSQNWTDTENWCSKKTAAANWTWAQKSECASELFLDIETRKPILNNPQIVKPKWEKLILTWQPIAMETTNSFFSQKWLDRWRKAYERWKDYWATSATIF